MVYLTAQAGALKTSTLSRRLAAIRAAHEPARAHLDLASSRGFREVWKGIKREPGTAKAKKTALLTPELRQGIEALPCDALTASATARSCSSASQVRSGAPSSSAVT